MGGFRGDKDTALCGGWVKGFRHLRCAEGDDRASAYQCSAIFVEGTVAAIAWTIHIDCAAGYS